MATTKKPTAATETAETAQANICSGRKKGSDKSGS